MHRWALATAMGVSFALLTGIPVAEAASRDCTQAERAEADARLIAIQNSTTDAQKILGRHLPFGVHTTTHAIEGQPSNEMLLLHDGYVLQHDGDLRTTLWVSYELVGAEVSAGDGKDRINCFRQDPRLPSDQAANPSDYDEPIYDQGHMVNDRDLKDDAVEQINTYVMSNMSPQHCRFNRGIWLTLEHLGRIWAKEYGKVHITAGAIFDFNNRDDRDRDRSAARMGSRSQKARVAVPSHYYKVFLRKIGREWQSIAFIMENHNGPRGASWKDVKPNLMDAITSLAVIEERSETSLHPALSRSSLIESVAGERWTFGRGESNLENGCPK